jgi:hypothetical protein
MCLRCTSADQLVIRPNITFHQSRRRKGVRVVDILCGLVIVGVTAMPITPRRQWPYTSAQKMACVAAMTLP